MIIERDDDEVELRVTLGAAEHSQQEVEQLYQSIREAEKEQTDSQLHISLHDVLQTPAYASIFEKYLESTHAADSLHFLLSEQSYRALTDEQAEKREYAARLIYEEFIVDGAAEAVNIDNQTKETIIKNVENKVRKRTRQLSDFLFHVASLPNFHCASVFVSVCVCRCLFHSYFLLQLKACIH